MKIILLTLFLFTGCASHHEKKVPEPQKTASAKKECLKYDQPVRIKGKIKELPYPNHKGSTYWILITEPFCTQIPIDEELYGAYDHETEIHLAMNDKYDLYRSFINKEGVAVGELFSAHTGHHRRNIIMRVDKIEEVK